ncbi:hypothetical protein F2Q68_00043017 [Brassica cretica]|uniref:Uncharacterized protein n=1 Tax=Brassica cretica TaxID=69181 RepID=A0A8S9LWB4_BRACR|nr:hypothetical protein F2Q68_00043017 [Brassica cretica]
MRRALKTIRENTIISRTTVLPPPDVTDHHGLALGVVAVHRRSMTLRARPANFCLSLIAWLQRPSLGSRARRIKKVWSWPRFSPDWLRWSSSGKVEHVLLGRVERGTKSWTSEMSSRTSVGLIWLGGVAAVGFRLKEKCSSRGFRNRQKGIRVSDKLIRRSGLSSKNDGVRVNDDIRSSSSSSRRRSCYDSGTNRSSENHREKESYLGEDRDGERWRTRRDRNRRRILLPVVYFRGSLYAFASVRSVVCMR